MELYLIRHADAAALGEQGITEDEARPLTEAGRLQAVQLARALQKRKVKLDLVLASPLVRTVQTAEGMLRTWSGPAPDYRPCEKLRPETRAKKLARRLGDLEVNAVALVGHQPFLAHYLGWFIGSKKAQVDIAKAGIACVSFPEKVGKGQGTLLWLVTSAWQSD